jgi:hypothetical protein
MKHTANKKINSKTVTAEARPRSFVPQPRLYANIGNVVVAFEGPPPVIR